MKKYFVVFVVLMFGLLCNPGGLKAFPMQISSAVVAKLKGSGIVKFKGSGKIAITGEGVIFAGEQGRVDLEGLSNFFENDEDGNRVFILPEENNVVIEGDNIDISFYGANFGYIVTATGFSHLSARGYGYYRVGLTMGVWTSDGIDVNFDVH